MSERLVKSGEEESHDHHELTDDLPKEHQSHHDHRDNVDLEDLVVDTQHMVDDLGEWFSQSQLDWTPEEHPDHQNLTTVNGK